MKIIQDYALAVVTLIVTLVLTLIADFVLRLSDEGTFLVFASGAIITLAATLLQKELVKSIKESESRLRSEMSQNLKLYELLDRIDDNDLQQAILELADDLSKGEIPPYIATERTRKLLTKTNESFQSSYQAESIQEIYEWRDYPRQRTWYKENLEAINRGVTIERHFLVRRDQMKKDGVWDERALDILKEQSDAGIIVRILWLEDLEYRPPQKNLVQIFNIFDEKEVIVPEGRYGTKIYRLPSEKVKQYREIFNEQKKYCSKIDELLEAK